jgi:glutamate dehydrogenase
MAYQLATETGAALADIVRAQLAARSIFDIGGLETQISRMPLDAACQSDVRLSLRYVVEQTARWLLRHQQSNDQSNPLDIRQCIDRYGAPSRHLVQRVSQLLPDQARQRWDHALHEWQQRGVAANVAHQLAAIGEMTGLLTIVELWHKLGQPAGNKPRDVLADDRRLEQLATAYFEVRDRFQLDRLLLKAEASPLTDQWQILARSDLQAELVDQTSALTEQILATGAQLPQAFEVYASQHPRSVAVTNQLNQLVNDDIDLARLMVVSRLLKDLLSQ